MGASPEGVTAAGSLLEVCGGSGVTGYGDTGSQALYGSAPLSRPPDGTVSQPLDRPLGPGGGEEMESFYKNQRLSTRAAQTLIRQNGLARSYMDPVLRRSKARYRERLELLRRSGILELVAEEISPELSSAESGAAEASDDEGAGASSAGEDSNVAELWDQVEKQFETIGVFFVQKKSGGLRIVLDCRKSNCYFTPHGGWS